MQQYGVQTYSPPEPNCLGLPGGFIWIVLKFGTQVVLICNYHPVKYEIFM